ncbi:MAG: hypothetical protein ACI4JJ_04695 [Huintestinicola sp.]
MNVTSKADMRAAECIAFANRHRWARYLCVGAVSVIYSAEFIRTKFISVGEKIRESMNAPFRPLYKRAASVLCAAAFARMIFPAEAAAAEVANAAPSEPTTVILPSLSPKVIPSGPPSILPPPEKPSSDEAEEQEEHQEEKRDYSVTLTGLAEENSMYSVEVDANLLETDVVAEFQESDDELGRILYAFSSYNIPTGNLYIVPYDITLYSSENEKLSLKDGMTAEITMPIPDEMSGHIGDIKAIRLEDNGRITVLGGVVNEGGDSYTISFETKHFSVFALVSYNDGIEGAYGGTAENISSAAGMTADGTAVMTASISFSNAVMDSDKRRRKASPKRKIYRIKRICSEKDILL